MKTGYIKSGVFADPHLVAVSYGSSLAREGFMYRYLLVIACLCIGNAAFAQAPDTVLMERLTSYEIRDAIAAGKTTVILPSGGTEQNGPGMAIGKHNFRALANADPGQDHHVAPDERVRLKNHAAALNLEQFR